MGGEAADLRKAVQSRGEAVLQEGVELVQSIDAPSSWDTGVWDLSAAPCCSVAYRLLHVAPCPVVVVKAPER